MVRDIKTKAEMDAVLAESKVVLADFWAPWCGPCKIQGPIFEDAAGKVADVTFIKVDVDEAGDIAGTYGIMSIPTLIVFKDGKEVKREVGVHDADHLIALTK